MPCSKGMVECKRACLHRRLVEEYRLARWSQLLQEEERTHGGRGERELERENYVDAPITFKQWIEGQARPQDVGEARSGSSLWSPYFSPPPQTNQPSVEESDVY